MQVDRRVTMARDEPYLFAELQFLCLRPEYQLAVLVRHVGELYVFAPMHPWRAFFAAVGLEPGVYNCAIGGSRADH